MNAASAIILDYGKRPPARWRLLLRWTVVALLLATLAFAGLFALRNLAIWIAKRQAYHTVAAWYRQAATTVVPAGTLLYSERAEDVQRSWSQGTHGTGAPHRSETFEGPYPTLRQIGSDGHGVPNTFEYGILYTHEHDYWDAPTGKRPALICVRYNHLDAQGHPEFFATAVRVAPIEMRVRFPAIGAATSVRENPGRSLANLRIFAGTPHPTDATRFNLPFDCDGGRGRFEFQTDTDVTDGGKVAPDVRIEWDDAATTRAAS